MSYAEEVPMGQGLDSVSGFRLKSEKAPHSTNFLSFQYPTVFRIFPEMMDGKEVPWRLSSRNGDFSAWAKGVRIAAKIGVLDRFTCIASPKGRASRDFGPIDLFHKAISDATQQDPRSFPADWKEWVTYRKGMGAKLSKPEYYMLLQGALFEHGGKQFINKQTNQWEPRIPSLLALKTSARIYLENLCNTDAPDWRGNPDDILNRYLIGDVFSLAGGSAIRVVPCPDDGMVRAHYKVENIKTPVLIPPKLAAENWWPWEQLLVYLTEEEQLRNLERCFPPEAVDYVFSRSPYAHMLSGHVRGAFSQKMAGNQVQGVGFGQGSQAAPAAYPMGSPAVTHPLPPVPVGSPSYPAVSQNPSIPMPPVEGDSGPAGFGGNVSQFRMAGPGLGGALGGFQPSASAAAPARGMGGPLGASAIGGMGNFAVPSEGPQVAPSAVSLPGASVSNMAVSPDHGTSQPVMGVNPSAVSATVDRLKAMKDKVGREGKQ